MKSITSIAVACAFVVLGTTSASFADEGDGAKHRDHHHKHRAAHRDKVDTNNDGKISEEERAADRAAHRERAKERADKNDDGKIGPKEREAAQKRKERVDKNDDGKVSHKEHHRAHHKRKQRAK